ncbi:Extracellular serine protease [compost metagenome]
MRTSTDVSFGETAAVLSGTVGWRHAFGDVVPTSTLAFAGGQGFTVGGAPIARDAALVEAGIDFKIALAATFGVNYTGQIASGVSDHGVNAKLKVSF